MYSFCSFYRNDWWDSLNSWWHNIWWVHSYLCTFVLRNLNFMWCILSDEESWNDIIVACSPLAAKWKQLSGFMGLSFKTIHAIKDSNYNPEDSWNEALMKWILQDYNTEKHGLPSWKSLLKTVSRVDPPLFEKLAKEHQLQVKGISIIMNFISCCHNTIEKV